MDTLSACRAGTVLYNLRIKVTRVSNSNIEIMSFHCSSVALSGVSTEILATHEHQESTFSMFLSVFPQSAC